MQDGKIIGQQVFFTKSKPEYVVFTHLHKYEEYIKISKWNLAERESKRLHVC